MKKYNLSNSEEILMNMLWKENAPLTVSQLSEKITEADWKPNYVDKLVKQLVKKGMVKADGIQQDRFYRSQQFVPCLTKDEFMAYFDGKYPTPLYDYEERYVESLKEHTSFY